MQEAEVGIENNAPIPILMVIYINELNVKHLMQVGMVLLIFDIDSQVHDCKGGWD